MDRVRTRRRLTATLGACALIVLLMQACDIADVGPSDFVTASPSPTTAASSLRPLPPPRASDGMKILPDTFEARAVPVSGAAEAGVLYRYRLGSHCGLGFWIAWDFDGIFWDPVPPVADDAGGNPPEGVDNPVDAGTIELTGPDTARYTSSHGVIVELQRSADAERQGRLCS